MKLRNKARKTMHRSHRAGQRKQPAPVAYRPVFGATGQRMERHVVELNAICSRMRIHANDDGKMARLRGELSTAIQGLHNNLPSTPITKPLTNWLEKIQQAEYKTSVDTTDELVQGVVIDVKGNYWKWNCGWYLVDKLGNPKATRQRKAEWFYASRDEVAARFDETEADIFCQAYDADTCFFHSKQRPDARQQPMGHVEFRSRVQLMNKTKERLLKFGKDRPGMQWRRVLDSPTYDHPTYGAVKLCATDGVKAVVQCEFGERETVMFANLTERKVPLARLFASKKEAKDRGNSEEALKAKAKSLFERYMNLADGEADEA